MHSLFAQLFAVNPRDKKLRFVLELVFSDSDRVVPGLVVVSRISPRLETCAGEHANVLGQGRGSQTSRRRRTAGHRLALRWASWKTVVEQMC